jgi:hypothetical protein
MFRRKEEESFTSRSVSRWWSGGRKFKGKRVSFLRHYKY